LFAQKLVKPQKRRITMRHKVAGKKAHVKKIGGKKRGRKSHSKRSVVKA